MAVIVVLFFMAITAAGNGLMDKPPVNKSVSQLVKSELSKTIHYPKKAKLQMVEGMVAAEFIVQPNGKIMVIRVDGHPAFVDSVEKQLRESQLKNVHVDNSQKLIMKFRFTIVPF